MNDKWSYTGVWDLHTIDTWDFRCPSCQGIAFTSLSEPKPGRALVPFDIKYADDTRPALGEPLKCQACGQSVPALTCYFEFNRGLEEL